MIWQTNLKKVAVLSPHGKRFQAVRLLPSNGTVWPMSELRITRNARASYRLVGTDPVVQNQHDCRTNHCFPCHNCLRATKHTHSIIAQYGMPANGPKCRATSPIQGASNFPNRRRSLRTIYSATIGDGDDFIAIPVSCTKVLPNSRPLMLGLGVENFDLRPRHRNARLIK